MGMPARCREHHRLQLYHTSKPRKKKEKSLHKRKVEINYEKANGQIDQNEISLAFCLLSTMSMALVPASSTILSGFATIAMLQSMRRDKVVTFC